MVYIELRDLELREIIENSYGFPVKRMGSAYVQKSLVEMTTKEQHHGNLSAFNIFHYESFTSACVMHMCEDL